MCGKIAANPKTLKQLGFFSYVNVMHFGHCSQQNNRPTGTDHRSRASTRQAAITNVAALVGVVAAENAHFMLKVAAVGFRPTNLLSPMRPAARLLAGQITISTMAGWQEPASNMLSAPNWTSKVEYDFVGLSNTSFTGLGFLQCQRGD
jgi:hypothetical protein